LNIKNDKLTPNTNANSHTTAGTINSPTNTVKNYSQKRPANNLQNFNNLSSSLNCLQYTLNQNMKTKVKSLLKSKNNKSTEGIKDAKISSKNMKFIN
jgi:N-acetylmuramoyl-L-alanine amidase CwlA